MLNKIYYWSFICLSSAYAVAVNAQPTVYPKPTDLAHPTAELRQQLGIQIKQINQDLANKIEQKQQIDDALEHTEGALKQSVVWLRQLQIKREASRQQLMQLKESLEQMNLGITEAEAQVKAAMVRLYRQKQQLEYSASPLLLGNESLISTRKKIYLATLFKLRQNDYRILTSKLFSLQELNYKLEVELARLDSQLGVSSQQHTQLILDTSKKQQQALAVTQQITKREQQLHHLRQAQAQLNKLLQKIAVGKHQRSEHTIATKALPELHSSNKLPYSSEDNGSFFTKALVKPLTGPIVLAFGQMRDSVRNNGVLVAPSTNAPVLAIASGTVLFSGELPNFGQIIVIDNGDNYTSVYSGVIANVVKGSVVKAGQTIANSGSTANQPMGGIYFELRHLGKPINPSSLF